ncbi:MAG TPA: fumarylacetoacetate hydrolase family protein [Steroidobacteraceae bacterium]
MLRSTSLPVAGRNTVYGAALNFRSTLEAMGSALSAKPYEAPPRAPVLYIKPPNTWIRNGEPIALPTDLPAVQAAATLAVVIGHDMYRVAATAALSYVEGFTVATDVAVPHSDYFRPTLRHRCRDGFCSIGSELVGLDDMPALDALELRVFVNARLACVESTRGLVRPVATLLADVSTLFTLAAGDIVLVGAAPGAPLVRAGDRVTVEIDGVARIENPVVAAADAPSAR